MHTSNLPEHLGGHKNKTHLDEGTLGYLINKYNVKTMLDIGCGPGGMVLLARDKGIESYGIDGDYSIQRPGVDSYITIHDYELGPSKLELTVDLIWSVEFVEHVWEKYQDNYMKDFQRGNFVLMTFAPPGKSGHHHVNCQEAEYWIEVFKKYGFRYDKDITDTIRAKSTMNVKTDKHSKKAWFQNNGLFFVKN
jgi:cyclopropane fatty-acyl-phospholipid synthase-like methyltransferase